MLERWIADRPFREASPPGQSDLDVARGPRARDILQDHWRNWIVESDWAWLAETGINTVRIPVSLMTPGMNPMYAPDRQFRLYPCRALSCPLSCVLPSQSERRGQQGAMPLCTRDDR